MEKVDSGRKLTNQQEMYIQWLANNKCDEDGKKITRLDFAKIIHVDPKTLYAWQKNIPGFWHLVADKVDDNYLKFLPEVHQAVKLRALKGDVPMIKFLYNQANRLKAERQEIATTINIDHALD